MNFATKMYSTIIKTSTVIGVCGGGYYGIKEANKNYCSKKDLTLIERAGEYLCFVYICLGYGFGGAMFGGIVGIISPISIPTILYVMIKNNNKPQIEQDIESKMGTISESKTPITSNHLGAYTRNFPTQLSGHNKLETRVLQNYIQSPKYISGIDSTNLKEETNSYNSNEER
jgi:hypothetical protein